MEIFWIFAWKNRNFCVKLPEKIGIFRKFALEIDFFTRIHDPQISNQIDAAVLSVYVHLAFYV